jgi:pilus assembly protein Flp/PilA
MFRRIELAATAWWIALQARATQEDGATAVEYALMVALIAMVIIAAVAFVGRATSSQFNSVGNCLDVTTNCS